MLIVALVLALIGLVALVFAVVTSNELVAWVCIGASFLGVVLLIIDAIRERQRRDAGAEGSDEDGTDEGAGDKALVEEDGYVDYPEEVSDEGDRGAKASEKAGADASEEPAVPTEGRGDDAK
jgi:membrane protein implicated in regulation of membrane protease activity